MCLKKSENNENEAYDVVQKNYKIENMNELIKDENYRTWIYNRCVASYDNTMLKNFED